MKSPKSVFIYGLKDPRDKRIYYVGKTSNLKRRLSQHLKDRKTNRCRAEWINELAASGLGPQMVVLEKTVMKEWRDAEIYWIAKGFEDGWPLTNIAAGGLPQQPDYAFFKPFVTEEIWTRFDSLGIREKDKICLDVARAMVSPIKSILLWKTKYMRFDWDWIQARQIDIGRDVARQLLE